MYVFLFDIDGTLVNTGGAGGMALMRAFREQFGVERPTNVPFSGRTDRGIVRNLFQSHGIPDSAENWQLLRDNYLKLLPQCLLECEGRILAGVSELIAEIGQRSDVALGLLTGNLRDGAQIKLTHFHLHESFAFGGFGDDHHDRDDVARAAWTAALPFLNGNPVHSWVIGDTPLDIRCGRAIGAQVLAVSTGVHDRDELAADQPDVLLDDLTDTERILATLFGDSA